MSTFGCLRPVVVLIGSLGWVACQKGAAAPTAPTASSSEPPAAEEAADAAAAAVAVEPIPVPMTCAGAASPDAGPGALCMPGDDFAKRFCKSSYPDVALVLMGRSSPFTRMYLRGDVDAWNADGGISARARLQFDEEMLVLRRREAPTNSVVVGAGGGYLVMRWDGSCYTLEDGELTARKPPVAKHPPIPWRKLAERTKDELLKNAKVLAAFQKRGKECKGVSTGEVSKACEAADAALSAAVVVETRAGLTLPTPDPLP